MRASLRLPINRFDLLLDPYRSCLRGAWIPPAPVSPMHLFAEEFTRDSPRQLGLFDRGGGEATAEVKQAINRRHGRFAIRSAATLPLKLIYADGAQVYDVRAEPTRRFPEFLSRIRPVAQLVTRRRHLTSGRVLRAHRVAAVY